MKTNAKERRCNARQWYSQLLAGCNAKSAVVVQRHESSNPNIRRVRLLSCIFLGTPVVIAESVDGLAGCIRELLQNINKTDKVKDYCECDFKTWLEEQYGLYLSYDDGLVLIFEKADCEE